MFRQRGFSLSFILSGLALLGIVGVVALPLANQIGYGVRVQNKTQSKNAVNLAVIKITQESAANDPDGDGTLEAPAFVVNAFAPAGGGILPGTTGAPKSDAWGRPLGYCAWDSGSNTASANMIPGDVRPSSGSAFFAVISAGPDSLFQTSCVQAMANSPQGDDILATITYAYAKQGVAGSLYYGNPVGNAAELAALNSSSLRPGSTRLQLDTNTIYRWDGGTWVVAGGVGGGGGGGQWKPPVTNLVDLPSSGNAVNDSRLVTSTGHIYIWNGTAWVATN